MAKGKQTNCLIIHLLINGLNKSHDIIMLGNTKKLK
jgi:hypothetical protein